MKWLVRKAKAEDATELFNLAKDFAEQEKMPGATDAQTEEVLVYQ